MTQRLVWNFEFTTPNQLALSDLKIKKEDDIKWEARFFWPETEIISLQLIDDSLLELAHYQQKQKQDYYYLISEQDYNLKSRRGELLYKPLMKKGKYSLGFGSKINLNESNNNSAAVESHVKKMMKQLDHSTEVLVKKESFTFKFSIHPPIKLELARIDIDQNIYFSLCIEGKSRNLVETISKGLLGKQPTCDYVSFLKKVTHHE